MNRLKRLVSIAKVKQSRSEVEKAITLRQVWSSNHIWGELGSFGESRGREENQVSDISFISTYMAFNKSKLGGTQNIAFALFESKIWAIIDTAEKYTIGDTRLNFEKCFNGFNLNSKVLI